MDLIFGNRKNNKKMDLWSICKATFVLDHSPFYPFIVNKTHAEFIIGAIVCDSPKRNDIINIFPLPTLRCAVDADKEDLDINKLDLDEIYIPPGVARHYPCIPINAKYTDKIDKFDTEYGIREYQYYVRASQALGNSMSFVNEYVKGAAAMVTAGELDKYVYAHAALNAGLTVQEIRAFAKCFVTIKLLVGVNIMHLKAKFNPKVLNYTRNVDKYSTAILKQFRKRKEFQPSTWNAACKILHNYSSLVNNADFYKDEDFERLLTQFRGFGVDLRTPTNVKDGNIPSYEVIR